MSIQDYSEVLRLFHPTVPSIGAKPKIDLSKLFDVSKGFPSNITPSDRGKVNKIINDIDDL